MMPVKAFKNDEYPDGRVLIDISADGTMRGIVILEGFIRQIPECQTFQTGLDTYAFFADLTGFISRTKAVTLIDGVEADDVLLELLTFWQRHGASADYRATWDAFLMCQREVHDGWAIAVNEYDGLLAQLKAPALVQPNAPSDEALDALPDGAKKKKSATRTSQKSTSTQPNSQPV